MLVRSGLPFPAPLPRLSLPIPHRTFDDVRNRERLRSLAPACYPPVVPDLRIEEHGRIRELDHDRVAPVDVAVVLALSPLPVRGQEVESDDVGHRPGRSLLVFGHAVTGRGLLTATGRGVGALILGETGLDPRLDTGLDGTALGVTSRGLLTATGHVGSVRVLLPAGEVGVTPSRSRDCERSRDRQPSSPVCSRSGEKGRLARRDRHEGAEVVVFQSPAVSEVSVGVTPAARGTSLSTLPSAVHDLARFFLSLSGSSSLGAVSGIAGVAASAVGPGGSVCPSTAAGVAVTTCASTVAPAGAGVPPAAPAAVPGVSGEQQRQEESHSRRHRCRSSSDGTDRRSKKQSRRRSPSPGPSSRRRERHYRASSDSSEEDRANVYPPRTGRAPGGTPGDARSSRAYDLSPCPGMSRSFAREDRYRSGAGRRSPAPSGAADDDRSSALESVDFDRDDSFRSVLGLIRNFHGMEEPAGVPSAHCKTPLASTYGLMSDVSPAFTLPASPLVRSLLDDTNLALAKFLEDPTVHGFLPVPGRRHRGYYRTSSFSFPGPYTVPPGVTS